MSVNSIISAVMTSMEQEVMLFSVAPAETSLPVSNYPDDKA